MGIEYLMNSKVLAARHKEEEIRCDSPLEILSWVVGGLNFLRGLFLFITFCCKMQVWNLVTKSCGRQKRPTTTGRSVPKQNIKGATTIVSGSSTTKADRCKNDEGMLRVKLPAVDNLTASVGEKDQRVGDHFKCHHSDLPEKCIKEKVSDELANPGHNVNLFCSRLSSEATDTSREIQNTGAEMKNLDEIVSTGDSQSVSTPANVEQSVKIGQNTPNATCAPNHHGGSENDSDGGSWSPVTMKRERQARRRSTRWTGRFSTSPSEWGAGWVRSLRLRMEVGQ